METLDIMTLNYVLVFVTVVTLMIIFRKDRRVVIGMIITMINLLVLPIALFIGGMSTDAPGSGRDEFFEEFFIIQGLPLLSYLSVPFIKNKQKARNTKNQTK